MYVRFESPPQPRTHGNDLKYELAAAETNHQRSSSCLLAYVKLPTLGVSSVTTTARPICVPNGYENLGFWRVGFGTNTARLPPSAY